MARRSGSYEVATIGYEGTAVDAFLDVLAGAKIEQLVDVRAVTSSRRPGFSKNQLAANLEGRGIDYVHLRALGTPSEGRSAVRSGDFEKMRKIYTKHLTTAEAQADLHALADLVRSGKHLVLLCYEADPEHCHRSMVIEALGDLGLKVRPRHLRIE